MNRIDRLTAILIQLQGKTRTEIEALEERFDVSRRTIFRDIRSLIEAGVPIGGDAGEGYFIVDGYHLPPVIFSREEASAILLAAKLVEKQADESTNKIFQDGLHKIRAVMKYSDQTYLENLEERMAIIGQPSVMKQGFPDSHLPEIQLALASQKKVLISYYSNYNDTSTQREVEPLGLVYYSGRWHMIGFCHLRQDMRDFRTDRIQEIQVLSESYNPNSHPNFLSFTDGLLGGTDAKEAVIKMTNKVARYVSDQKFYYGFISEKPVGDDHVEMTFVTPQYEFLARWLMMFGSDATILSPSELQGRMAQLASELFEHHRAYFK